MGNFIVPIKIIITFLLFCNFCNLIRDCNSNCFCKYCNYVFYYMFRKHLLNCFTARMISKSKCSKKTGFLKMKVKNHSKINFFIKIYLRFPKILRKKTRCDKIELSHCPSFLKSSQLFILMHRE